MKALAAFSVALGALLVLADEPGALVAAREAHGGAKLADVKNVRLEGTLRVANVVYRYVETWDDERLRCVYTAPTGEVVKTWDGKAGWVRSGGLEAMSEEEGKRFQEGLKLRKMLLLRFPESPVLEDGSLRSGAYSLEFGDGGRLSRIAFRVGEQEAAWKLENYLEVGEVRLPHRWRVTVKGVPAASSTYAFARAETNVELPEDFFSADAAK